MKALLRMLDKYPPWTDIIIQGKGFRGLIIKPYTMSCPAKTTRKFFGGDK